MAHQSLSPSPKELSPDGALQGQRMKQFLSQMMWNLNNSTSLDDFRTWVNEHLPQNHDPCQFLHLLPPCQKVVSEPSVGSVPMPNSLVSLARYGVNDEDGSCWDENVQAVLSPVVRLSVKCDSLHLDTPLYSERGAPTLSVPPGVALTDEMSLPYVTYNSADVKVNNTHSKENNTVDKDVASFLQLSFSWASNPMFRGTESFGFCKRLCGAGFSPLGRLYSRSNTTNLSTSLLVDNSLSTSCGHSRTGVPPLQRDLSILHSCSNGNFAEGMPNFSIEGFLPDQKVLFSRPSLRHTAVFCPMEEVQEALSSIDVPFLEDLDLPSVDVLKYWERYGTNDYVYTCLNVLLRYNFSRLFGFDLTRLHCFYKTAVTYIRARNPLQNTSHAANIVAAAHHFLMQQHFAENFSDEELFSFLFASTVMKLGNTGATNRFLIAVRHPYVVAHSYFSPLQSVSVSLAFALLDTPDCHFLTFTPANQGKDSGVSSTAWTRVKEMEMYETVTQLIMATDERNHYSLFNDLKVILGDAAGKVVYEHHIMTLLRSILHSINFCYLFRCLAVFKAASLCSVVELFRMNHAIHQIANGNGMRWPTRRYECSRFHEASEESTGVEKTVAEEQNITPLKSMQDFCGNVLRMESSTTEFLDVVNGPTPSDFSMTQSALAAELEALVQSPEHCAKNMYLAMMEVVFMPFMEVLSQVVPTSWLTNMEDNVLWLHDYSAEAFEADALRTQRDVDRWDAVLPMGTDDFEHRVFQRIRGPFA